MKLWSFQADVLKSGSFLEALNALWGTPAGQECDSGKMCATWLKRAWTSVDCAYVKNDAVCEAVQNADKLSALQMHLDVSQTTVKDSLSTYRSATVQPQVVNCGDWG